MTSGLAPKWASAPASTIRAVLAEREMSTEDLANALGISEADAIDLLDQRLSINADLATRLSFGLGASARFWLTREAEYIEDRLRVLAADWSNTLPVSQMSQFGWIDGPRNWRERIEACLGFFGVDDIEEWQEHYSTQVSVAHYRKSPSFENDERSTLVWFRAGERAVEGHVDLRPFDAQQLRNRLPALRTLTRQADPAKFIPELQRLCAQAGLLVAVVRAPNGCKVSGASRWVKGGRPLVQLSARHRSDDHLWFTFFHEIGHVLLHGAEHQPFIDLDASPGDEKDTFEDEADRFAESVLLGDGAVADEIRAADMREIIRFAARLGVSPGIVVGQLQHSGRLTNDQMNHLKRRYQWEATTLVAS